MHKKSLIHEIATRHEASDYTKNQAKFLFFDGRKHKIDGPIEKTLNAMPANGKDHMGKIF